MTKKVTQQWVNRIEALQYEVTARRELLTHMIGTGVSFEADGYRRYHAEYLEFFRKYEEAKEAFAEEYVYPETDGKRVDWNLDFKACEVTF